MCPDRICLSSWVLLEYFTSDLKQPESMIWCFSGVVLVFVVTQQYFSRLQSKQCCKQFQSHFSQLWEVILTIINHSLLVSWWELFNALQHLYLLMSGVFFPVSLISINVLAVSLFQDGNDWCCSILIRTLLPTAGSSSPSSIIFLCKNSSYSSCWSVYCFPFLSCIMWSSNQIV